MAQNTKKQLKPQNQNHQNSKAVSETNNHSGDLKGGSNVALMAMGEIFLLAILKAAVGFSTGIVVLIADAVASFSDVIGLFASYIGLKMSQRKADKGFKYGYYKAESLAAFLASLSIVYAGYEVLRESIARLFVLEESQNQYLAVGQVIITVLISLHLTYYLMKEGKKIHSLSIINSAKDKRNDIFSEIPVAIGIAASYFKIPYLEGLIGIALSLVILKVGLESGKESLFFLLDYFDDQDLVGKVESTILSGSRIITRVPNIRMRRAGTYIFGEAFVEVNPYIEAQDIRNDLKNLQEKILKLDSQIKDFSIFLEIPETHQVRVAVPVKENNGLKSEIATTIALTKFYIFVDVVEGKITNFSVKPFEFKPFQYFEMANFLKTEKAKIVINNNMDSLLFYNLRRLQHLLIYPHFNNVTDVENTIKLLVIDT